MPLGIPLIVPVPLKVRVRPAIVAVTGALPPTSLTVKVTEPFPETALVDISVMKFSGVVGSGSGFGVGCGAGVGLGLRSAGAGGCGFGAGVGVLLSGSSCFLAASARLLASLANGSQVSLMALAVVLAVASYSLVLSSLGVGVLVCACGLF